MNIISKIQNLPKRTRKIILWVVTVIIGTSLLFLWLNYVRKRLREFPKRRFIETIKTIPSENIILERK